MIDMQHHIRAEMLDEEPPKAIAPPSPVAPAYVAPVPPRDWRAIAFIVGGLILLAATVLAAWRLSDMTHAQPAPAAVVAIQPIVLTYGGIERTIDTHPLTGKRAWIPIHMVHPLSRETYTTYCAVCHDPFGGRAMMSPRGR